MSNDNWETPQWLFDKLNAEFHFTWDVCATANNKKCLNFWPEELNGLKREWGKVNWCNPPYSDQMPWAKRADFEAKLGGGTTVMLCMCDTSTQFFKFCALRADEIRLLDARVKFVGATGSPRFASMVVVFRPKETTCPTMERNAIISVVSYRED